MVDDLKQGGEELRHSPDKPKSATAAREEEILAFWEREKIFEKSLEKPAPEGEYVFYDGPPFANGMPHYGHILASTIKDAIPRYRTMQGYHVPRRWGWDCHGLPVENLVEKELGFKNKRDIEEFGIEKFNEAARKSIMKDVSDWKRIIPRLGRWVDMEHDYKTMNAGYTQSVWWAFKNLYDRGLIYEGFKAMQLCPRCGTTLSNFEVAQGYKDIDDIAVTVKLPLMDEEGTSLLIWTTTPWTLPGNAAAAVKADAVYVKVKVGNEHVIVAKDLNKLEGEVIAEFSGKELVGRRYEPPFNYFKNELHKHKTHAWRVYAADFVTMDSGTGVVHIAPAFGADDLALAQKEKIPLIHHVTDEGKFVAAVADFAHLPVKPKGNPKETDQKIAEYLQVKGLLFAEEKIKHSYPHCWRCDTPLLNWAANSWFVNVAALKGKLVRENKKVSWVPEHVGRGRFNNGLESAPDWAISRTRFWGAPLPVWRHSKTKEIKVAGSVEEMLSMVRRSGNKYFVMRHGEAKSNATNIDDLSGDNDNHLTEKGKTDTKRAALELRKNNIDIIIVSPFLRTCETAAIVQQELGLPDSAVMIDERLHESNSRQPDEVRRRVGEFLFEVERRYANKTVLIISHGYPLWVMAQVAARRGLKGFSRADMLHPAQAQKLSFTPYPHNADYELDLHRPYIDEVPMGDSLKGEWKRVPDVFDCWFESGSMPYASNNYPAEQRVFNPKRFFGFSPKGYPADFIAEGLDQTRGWFYSLIVLGTALFNKTPYKHVIVNGLVLASDGQKMSKRLKNYPDPMDMVETYGADALRYYLLSSPLLRGEDLRLQEKGIDEISKKILMRLDNVRSFYQLYAEARQKLPEKGEMNTTPTPFSKTFTEPKNVLDKWILSRLAQLVEETTAGFESYELDTATRPLMEFVDDLSNWYVRRSRDRFKEEGDDKQQALATLHRVLYTLSQLLAPVMPFYAEYLFREMREENDVESVHLSNWPEAAAIDLPLIANMQEVRTIASQALQLREKAGIKIRQPLAKLAVRRLSLGAELRALIAEELNVKEVVENTALEQDLRLDTELTAELKEEGILRNVIRRIQESRKEQGLKINDRPRDFFVGVFSKEEATIVKKYRTEILSATNVESLEIKTDA